MIFFCFFLGKEVCALLRRLTPPFETRPLIFLYEFNGALKPSGPMIEEVLRKLPEKEFDLAINPFAPSLVIVREGSKEAVLRSPPIGQLDKDFDFFIGSVEPIKPVGGNRVADLPRLGLPLDIGKLNEKEFDFLDCPAFIVPLVWGLNSPYSKELICSRVLL